MNDQFLHPGVASEVDALVHARANGYVVKPADTPGALIVTFYSNYFLLTAFVYDNEQEWASDLSLLKTALPDLAEGETIGRGKDPVKEVPAIKAPDPLLENEPEKNAGAGSPQTEQPAAEEEKQEITFKHDILAEEVESFEAAKITQYAMQDSAGVVLQFYRGHSLVFVYEYASPADRQHDITNVLKLLPLLIEIGHTQPA